MTAEPTEPDEPCGCHSAAQVIRLVGERALTYRQLDYWVRQGWLPAHTHPGGKRTTATRTAETGQGSGIGRGFDPLDAARAVVAAMYIQQFPGLGPQLALQLAATGEVAGKTYGVKLTVGGAP